MPFDDTGTYTPPSGAEDAFPGQVIASATWNAIFTDISTALTLLGQLGLLEPTIETTAGPFVITTETYIALNKGAPSATAFTLPAVSHVTDKLYVLLIGRVMLGISLSPRQVGETIEGMGSWIVASSGGHGLGGKITLKPSVSLSGWVVLPWR